MPEPFTIMIALTGLGVSGLVVAGRGIRNAIRRRRIDRRLDGGRGTFVDGEPTTVVGKVRAVRSTLSAPFSGTPCVAYRALAGFAPAKYAAIYEDPDPTIEHSEVVPFELETTQGTVLVDASEATLLFAPRPVIPRNVEREAAFMRKLGIQTAMREVSCHEAYVEVDRRVAVHGVLFLEPAPTESYRETAIRARIRPGHAAITIGKP